MAVKRRAFVFRPHAFISLLTAFSFLSMSTSGVILYIAPSGRDAGNWSVWALSRNDWVTLHLSFSAVFLIAALIHLWLNRKPLLHYLSIKTKATAQLRWEWLAALFLAVLTVWGTLRPFEPFASLLEMRQRFRISPVQSSPDNNTVEQSVGMGQLTLDAYCNQIGLDVRRAIEILEKEGITARKTDSLRAIADRNNLHPARIRGLLDTVLP